VKRFVYVAVTVCFVVTLWAVPGFTKQAGEIKDGVYTDKDYQFSLKIPVGWSAKVKEAKSALRLSMDQTSAVPPEHLTGDLRDYMQIPTVVVIVDTTSLTVGQFIDNLLSPKFESKQKDGMLRLLKLISRPHEVLKRSEITFENAPATMIEARQPYEMEVSGRGAELDADSLDSDRANVINDHKYGSMFFTVRDGHIYAIHLICEYKTSSSIVEIYNAMIGSLKFAPVAEVKEAKE
jgi:hypothetical protein